MKRLILLIFLFVCIQQYAVARGKSDQRAVKFFRSYKHNLRNAKAFKTECYKNADLNVFEIQRKKNSKFLFRINEINIPDEAESSIALAFPGFQLEGYYLLLTNDSNCSFAILKKDRHYFLLKMVDLQNVRIIKTEKSHR